MAKLKAPRGSNGCSFEGIEYETDNDGIVEVPGKAVETLIKSFGFVFADDDNSSNLVSDPPQDAYKIENLYVDSAGKLIIKYNK